MAYTALRYHALWLLKVVPVSLLLIAFAAHAEIYRWVDANGRVHFSDKRAANKAAQPLADTTTPVTSDGFTFRFAPEADALLANNSQQPQGKSRVLSTGYWLTNNTSFETKSLLRFEISALLRELHNQPQKKLETATLELFANTQDKLYGQGITNRESPGHSSLRGDNAFYLKPAHNNWLEAEVVWSDYYSPSHYTPTLVRQLPTVSVSGSDGVPDFDFKVDVTELVAALLLAKQREVTLELSPQRKSNMAQVTFFAREAEPEQAPRLTVTLR